MNVYHLPSAARPLRSRPALSVVSSSTPPSPSRQASPKLAAAVIATQVTALGVREGRTINLSTLALAVFIGTGLALMAYAWLAFSGLVAWWAP